MCYNFKDKVVVVFGAGNTLGENLCIHLTEAEADVVGIDLIKGNAVDFTIHSYDTEDIRRVLNKVMDSVGFIHGIVNNLFYSDEMLQDRIKNTSNIVNESLSCLCRNSSIVNIEKDFDIPPESIGINNHDIRISSSIAMDSITKKYSEKLAPTTRVNCIVGGDIFTEDKSLKMKRRATPSEISNPVMFLLSDESSYITGQSIKVG